LVSFENSDRLIPAGGTVSVKVFTVRSLSDISRFDIYTGYIYKNFQTCPFNVYVRTMPPLVCLPKFVPHNDSYNQTVYDDGFEIEMLKVIGNALNMSLDIASVKEVLGILIAAGRKEDEGIKGETFIFVGWFPAVIYEVDNFCEFTRSYINERLVWYTPCAVKYQR
jgi:hypothetical protein